MDHNRPTEDLRHQAVALRRAGKSRRQIAEILHITSKDVLDKLVRGEPAPEWTKRPNTKDTLRAKARALRTEGRSYNEIAAELGVSKSSCSLWLRDMPRPIGKEEQVRRSRAARAPGDEARRASADEHRAAVKAEAAQQIGALSDHDLTLAGAIIYWCEGAKKRGQVAFCNNDPAMIDLFLRFLDVAGVPRDSLRFQLQIHQDSDHAEAQQFWLAITGSGPERFGKATIKQSKTGTSRLNVGADYHGCLRVEVRGGSGLDRRIEGLARAILGTERELIAGLPAGVPVTETRLRALELRRAGCSRATIQERLALGSPVLVDALIRAEPPAICWTRRATAEQINEDLARELQAQGWGCRRISDRLGASRDDVRRWLGTLPHLADGPRTGAEGRVAGIRRHWNEKRTVEEIDRQLAWETAATQVGALTEREVKLLGSLAYWCEGGKDKPYRRTERVRFINRDPGLVRFFLRFLVLAGVEWPRISFRVHIHESGDLGSARRFWADVTGADSAGFGKDRIKRHVPKTVYPEIQNDYHGCLEVGVAGSAELYRRIEGWALGPVLGEKAARARWPAAPETVIRDGRVR